MKISELEELLAAARKTFGDRDVGLVYESKGLMFFEEPQITKWFLKPESENNFAVSLS